MIHSQRRVFGNGIRLSHRNLEFFGLQFEVGRLAPEPSLGPAVAQSWSVPFRVFYLRRSAFICGWPLLFASIRSLSRRRLGGGGSIRGSDLLSRPESLVLFDTCSSLIHPDLLLSDLLPMDFAKPSGALRCFDCGSYRMLPDVKSGGKQSS